MRDDEIQTMPYGMYRMDKDFIRHMREREPKVLDPELTDLYVGPVMTADGGWGFYAPVTPKPDDSDKAVLTEKAVISGFIHICKMLPCHPKGLTPDTENTPERAFCMRAENREFIELMAKAAYEVNCGKREEE